MKFEHFALNIKDPIATSKWYEENLGMRTVKKMDEPPFTRFIADSSGQVVFELFCNESATVTDYNTKHPLEFHVAFTADNAEDVKQRLMKAGATFVEEINAPDGSHLVMLRDPQGIPLQICQRAMPLK